MGWVVRYFRKSDGSVPARQFEGLLSQKLKLRAKLHRMTKEVADSEGRLGGGYFEPCHGWDDLCEIRVIQGSDLARFICARHGESLVLLEGVLKRVREETPQSVFAQAVENLREYRETRDAL